MGQSQQLNCIQDNLGVAAVATSSMGKSLVNAKQIKWAFSGREAGTQVLCRTDAWHIFAVQLAWSFVLQHGVPSNKAFNRLNCFHGGLIWSETGLVCQWLTIVRAGKPWGEMQPTQPIHGAVEMETLMVNPQGSTISLKQKWVTRAVRKGNAIYVQLIHLFLCFFLFGESLLLLDEERLCFFRFSLCLRRFSSSSANNCCK
jgi:hypothetical protein